MLSYAGIGTRGITIQEQNLIENLAFQLSNNFILYSGNTNGADISFQTGSTGNCVLMLPWGSFNRDHYSSSNALESFVVGDTEEGQKALEEYHPNTKKLSQGARRCLTRNYHQIMGYKTHSPVKFVLCCASVDKNGEIIGGTGHACRIARAHNIPIFNLRVDTWTVKFHTLIRTLLQK